MHRKPSTSKTNCDVNTELVYRSGMLGAKLSVMDEL